MTTLSTSIWLMNLPLTPNNQNLNDMKQWIISLLLIITPLTVVQASGNKGLQQYLTKEEFCARQQAFITKQAALTEAEAEGFFPLYFELQERKRQLNEEVWSAFKSGRKENVSEARYEEILEGIYDNRLAIDRLEKSYFEKFKKILSFKKIYLVQRAEMRFHREVLKNFGEKNKPADSARRKSQKNK